LALSHAVGTEATATFVGSAIARVVATVWTTQGKYASEYYRTDNRLVMAYETFAYFEEAAPPGAWRNFMGHAAWERRTYFDSRGGVAYAEARGSHAPAPGGGVDQLRLQADRLVRLLQPRAN
jgi:hypothetical protein